MVYLLEPHGTEAAGTSKMLLAKSSVKLKGLPAEVRVLGLAVKRTVLGTSGGTSNKIQVQAKGGATQKRRLYPAAAGGTVKGSKLLYQAEEQNFISFSPRDARVPVIYASERKVNSSWN